ncbi:MAG: glutamate--tRNA ligase [Candidatus Tagabacteria bacterium CG09_land_8_20_14_0_10_41_14]|uniref:Glutamate--tRNA ligase n=1 Tax=Candidatus Tagabacteria bacterium CG09_land_8_20_14_0_10_41_14 TaxID=1975021 RepID=A0A2H0WLJ9_9BACT|nr:MAG: glutamate--tRNA ligase [Candidatus Tagabacteria bacterium CG09_land_8_20_14_0_10_41_14]
MMNFLNFLNSKKIRTRLAPSPTGPLHVGTARTALFNYIFARQNNGNFILRIDDTDKERSDKRFEEDILNGLKWLGLEYDKIYRQSEREDIYKNYLKKLLDKKIAFWCYHSKEELAAEKTEQMNKKEAPRHVCNHKNIKSLNHKNKNGIIRLGGSDEKIKFNDLIRGEIEYDASLLGDIAIAKDEKTPLYNFASVIDDEEMKISHVIRGEDHIPNTPKQILIQKALKIQTPFYAHLPLILGPDKSKMSKRHGSISINEYKRMGYLAQALLNFIILLGWNPGNDKEFFEKEEMLELFSLQKIQKGGAVFNIEKLNWFNREYIKKMSMGKLSQHTMEYISSEWKAQINKDKKLWYKILELEKPRLNVLSEIKERVDFFFEKPQLSRSLLIHTFSNTSQHLDKTEKILSSIDRHSFGAENIKKALWDYAEEKGRGNVLWPFRAALTGKAKSPDPFSVAEILGKKETLKRIQHAKEIIT